MSRPLVIGLTGSIGMGKSTVAAMFRREGVPVFDADATVRALQGTAGSLVTAIEQLFPGSTGAAGVDRASLAARVLGDRTALLRLEALVHPAVATERRRFLRRYAAQRLLVLDVPLLLESVAPGRVDLVVVVSAPAAVQRRRVLARSGMTGARLAAVMARQLPDREKRRRADVVIPTGGGIDQTRAAVHRLIACLRAHPVRYCRPCARSFSIPRPRG